MIKGILKMRFYEFKPRKLLEYKEDLSDNDLQDEIIGLLKDENDRVMLDKIYQVLKKSTLEGRIKKALLADDDMKTKLDIFAGLIFNTEGTFAEKEKFIENFDKGYIDTKVLRDENKIKNYESWIIGDEFVTRVFNNLYSYTPQGIGPGEYALAVLSQNIKFAGRSSEMHGDLVIDGVMCEVKAKQSSGGRFSDPRKAMIDMSAIRRHAEDLGIEPGKGISALMWTSKVRPTLKPADIKALVKTILKGCFHFVKLNELSKLRKAMESGDSDQIKQEWGLMSFLNYKRMSKFDSMLLLDSPKKQSLYFTDAQDVSAKLNAGQPYLVGPEQQVMPQVIFK